MSKSKILDRADGRPRVYIRARRDGRAGWSHSPNGLERVTSTPGAALDDALGELGGVNAVVIFEGPDTPQRRTD
ncbi:MAG: hypothetical protein V4530_06280 [Pseudomonadota bacterium]